MSEKSDRISVMQRTLDWASQIEVIGGPMGFGDTRESWLARVARKSGATFRQIKALYYREVNDPKFSLAAQIITAADRARIEEARRDAAKLANTYQSTAQALGNIDQDFHRSDIDALVSAARILGSLDSA
jgi:hypothetical protein